MGEAIGECLSLIGVDGLPPLPSLGELLTVTPFALSALDAPTSAPPSAPPRSPPRPAPCALASALCRLWRALPRAVLTRHVLSLEPFLGAASAQRLVLPCLEAALLPPPAADPAAAAALPAFTTAAPLPAAILPAAAPDVLMLPVAAEASGAAATEGGEPTQRDGGLARGGLARESREGWRGRAAGRAGGLRRSREAESGEARPSPSPRPGSAAALASPRGHGGAKRQRRAEHPWPEEDASALPSGGQPTSHDGASVVRRRLVEISDAVWLPDAARAIPAPARPGADADADAADAVGGGSAGREGGAVAAFRRLSGVALVLLRASSSAEAEAARSAVLRRVGEASGLVGGGRGKRKCAESAARLL